jgi:hypothetical protein
MATGIGLIGALVVAGMGAPPAAPSAGPSFTVSRQELSSVVAGATVAPQATAGAPVALTAPIDVPGNAGFGIQAVAINTGIASANQSTVSVIANVILAPGFGASSR